LDIKSRIFKQLCSGRFAAFARMEQEPTFGLLLFLLGQEVSCFSWEQQYLSAIAKPGGVARAESLRAEQRKAIATKASKAAAAARTRKAPT
jgi:hypothetical protein